MGSPFWGVRGGAPEKILSLIRDLPRCYSVLLSLVLLFLDTLNQEGKDILVKES